MSAKLYPWQESTWQQWQSLIEQDRLPHAMLCAMPEGSGREALAAYLSNTLLCKTPGNDPCGLCHSCDLLRSETHPDLHWITPEKEGKAITVDQIRQCNHWAWESSQLSGLRVIVIDPAENMNEAAANALLKTLEAPPASCHFILLSASTHRLLPTILSRCNVWHQPHLSEEVVLSWLEQQGTHKVSKQSLRLCQGLPLSSLQFHQDKKDKQHQQLLTSFTSFIESGFGSLSDILPLIGKERDAALLWLSYLLADIQKVQQGVVEGVVHCNSMEVLRTLSSKLSINTVHQQFKSLNELRNQLNVHSGLNEELLISQWLFGFITGEQGVS